MKKCTKMKFNIGLSTFFMLYIRIMFYSFKGFVPVVHPTSIVHPLAAVTGNVIIGKHCYIGPGAALRGDWGGIVLEDGCNVQENCTIHMFPGVTVLLQEGAHIGHGAIIHGAQIGRNCLVGMNAVIMDNVVLGNESIVGALAFIREGEQIPPRSLVVGNPARIVKQVSDEMIEWKTKGTRLYQALPAEMMKEAMPCEPLTELPADRPLQEQLFTTWKTISET
jgi:phenylacetic acid degradation protein/carnitine operon protein CaiE